MKQDLREQLQHLRHQWPSTSQHMPRLTTHQCEIHLAFSLETGDTRGSSVGRAGKQRPCPIRAVNLHVAHKGSRQPCKSHLPIATISTVTTPRNTAGLPTRSLSEFTETTEGQESHHPGTEDKHSELKGNLTGQK